MSDAPAAKPRERNRQRKPAPSAAGASRDNGAGSTSRGKRGAPPQTSAAANGGGRGTVPAEKRAGGPVIIHTAVRAVAEALRANFDLAKSAQQRRILAALMSPFTEPALVYGGRFGSRPLVPASPFQVTKFPWSQSAAPSNVGDCYLDISEAFAIVRRDPRCALMIYDPNQDSGAPGQSVYTVQFQGPNGQPATTVSIVTNQWFPYVGLAWSSGRNHGQLAAFLDDDGVPYVWIDSPTTSGAAVTAQSIVLISGLPASTLVTLRIRRYLGGVTTEFVYVPTTTAGGTLTWTVPRGGCGYYAFAFTAGLSNNIATTLAATITWQCSTLRHLAMPGYAANAGSIDAMAVTAASLMYSNSAATLNRQGTVIGYQCPASNEWTNILGMTGTASLGGVASVNAGGLTSALGSYKGHRQLQADKGIYGWLRPAADADMDLQPLAERPAANARVIEPCPLVPNSDYLIVAISITTAAGRDGWLTVAWGAAYETDDVFRVPYQIEFDTPTIERATWLAGKAEQWSCNPLHLSDIWAWIRRAAPSVASMADLAGPLLGPYAPVASVIGNVARALK